MSHDSSAVLSHPQTTMDYSLTGENATRAIERGLAEADWYQSPVPRATMRRLLERHNGPALRDTILWFALILGSGLATWYLWPSRWAALPYALYAVLYSSTSDSRWHESGHGTAFRTDWLNNALYEIASFMVTRESIVWRWSHTRHHSDTIIVGRDPEIAVPRPPNIRSIILGFFGIPNYPKYLQHIVMHSLRRMSADEKTFIPSNEFPKIYFRARVYLAIYAAVIGFAIYSRSILPLLFVGLTDLMGKWLMVVYGLTQHAGLAENVLDHRLNCRTLCMNRLNRFLYWNMNYHVEHHMFPLVPYHALPALHAAVKSDMPTPYSGLLAAWREIIPTVWRQLKDPAYHVKRTLPERKADRAEFIRASEARPDTKGWLEVCASVELSRSDVLRFDHCRKTYALVRDEKMALYALDGICTHGNTHLADGLVKGDIIECPKHNGRFFLADGSPARAPVCRGLATYLVEERRDRIYINIESARAAGAREPKAVQLRVVSNRSVATFIKELTLEPIDTKETIAFTPGDYFQLNIPPFDCIRFRDFDIPQPYTAVWENQHVFDLVACNSQTGRRNNYSLASNQELERTLRFNVRIATPPPGQNCPPGMGSAYAFSLKPGDIVSAIGPFGDFHIKPTQREMVYIGGGAGMAPLRAHLSYLFETEKTHRKVSFWYGARSRQEIYYDVLFRQFAAAHANFDFRLALSSPLAEDNWTGYTGFIHEVVRDQYLKTHADPRAIEYYLCGPPMMIRACTRMLAELAVPTSHIAYDEF